MGSFSHETHCFLRFVSHRVSNGRHSADSFGVPFVNFLTDGSAGENAAVSTPTIQPGTGSGAKITES
jgi:hypothetical protein